MKLIVGLGNPGTRYAATRHNVGFMVIDELCTALGVSLAQKFKGGFGKSHLKNREIGLLKPLTYMNLSGESVAAVMNFYKIPANDVLVVHDELDFPFGKIRLKKNGGDGGHKGLSSIIEYIGDNTFSRLRVGIDKPLDGDVTRHVLAPFTNEELSQLGDILRKAESMIAMTIEFGIDTAMNAYH